MNQPGHTALRFPLPTFQMHAGVHSLAGCGLSGGGMLALAWLDVIPAS